MVRTSPFPPIICLGEIITAIIEHTVFDVKEILLIHQAHLHRISRIDFCIDEIVCAGFVLTLTHAKVTVWCGVDVERVDKAIGAAGAVGHNQFALCFFIEKIRMRHPNNARRTFKLLVLTIGRVEVVALVVCTFEINKAHPADAEDAKFSGFLGRKIELHRQVLILRNGAAGAEVNTQ